MPSPLAERALARMAREQTPRAPKPGAAGAERMRARQERIAQADRLRVLRAAVRRSAKLPRKPDYMAVLEAQARAWALGMMAALRAQLASILAPERADAVDDPAESTRSRILKRKAEAINSRLAAIAKRPPPATRSTILRKRAASLAERVEAAGRGAANKQLEPLLGNVALWTTPSKRQRTLMAGWAEETVGLLGSVPEALHADLAATVAKAVERATEPEVLARRLSRRFAVAEGRAVMVARDQTQKLGARMEQARQTEAGIAQYRWRTQRDDRVRRMHRALDTTVHAWDDPPITNDDGDHNHPGEDYNCRCVAEPVPSAVLAALTSE